VIDAATIAGINVIRLINDHTAVAIFYLYMNNRNITDDEIRNVFFIDMGGANTSVSVVEFKKNKEQSGFKILSSAYDPELGGRDIDLALAYYFAERFNKKHKIDLKEIPKCWIRLLMACEGVKKIFKSWKCS